MMMIGRENLAIVVALQKVFNEIITSKTIKYHRDKFIIPMIKKNSLLQTLLTWNGFTYKNKEFRSDNLWGLLPVLHPNLHEEFEPMYKEILEDELNIQFALKAVNAALSAIDNWEELPLFLPEQLLNHLPPEAYNSLFGKDCNHEPRRLQMFLSNYTDELLHLKKILLINSLGE